MRKDLAKCTTERERYNSSAPSKKYGGKIKPQSEDSTYDKEAGGFKSSSRRRQENHKSLSDQLSPLRGNIRKNVGRPWDKVYSEFCSFLDKSSVSGQHIIQHLKWEVELNCFLGGNGKIWTRQYGWEREVDGYYVHPITGILSFQPKPSRREQRRKRYVDTPIEELQIGEVNYRKEDGLWYKGDFKIQYELRHITKPTWAGEYVYNRGYWYPTIWKNKQQVGKSEIKLINATIAKIKKSRNI